jgi:hypothetical protein
MYIHDIEKHLNNKEQLLKQNTNEIEKLKNEIKILKFKLLEKQINI